VLIQLFINDSLLSLTACQAHRTTIGLRSQNSQKSSTKGSQLA